MIPASACQAAIGKTMVKYQKSSLKAFNKCEDGLDKGKVFGCPDTRTAESVAKAHTKVEQGIARACTNAEIVSLDSGGAFGGSCSGSVDTTDLAACQVAEYDVASSALVALIDSAEGVGTVSFVVPGGADRFRATVNAVVGGGNDVDLYVRHGSPPTKSVFDAQSAVGGVFEGVEIANPTAGEWFVLVDEASGNNIPTQVTITIFP